MFKFLTALAFLALTAVSGPLFAATITGVTASSSSDYNGVTASSRTVDGSGLSGSTHATAFQQHWFSDQAPTTLGDEYIEWNLGDLYVVDSVQVWNGNQFAGTNGSSPFSTDEGINQLDIYVSSVASPGDPEGAGAANWTLLAQNTTFSEALGVSTYTGFDLATEIGVALPTTAIRWMRFEVDTNHGGAGTDNVASLSEIRFDGELFQVVPEPHTYSLLLLGVLSSWCLVYRTRR